MKKQISYKDISEMAGVSISTISRYYNNGYVSKKTKEKIESVVKQHRYYPNHGARMIRGKDHSVFVIMPEWEQNVSLAITSGIVQACKKNGRRVNTTYTGVSTEEYIETIRYILSWRPTSIVVFVANYDIKLFDFLKDIDDVSIVVFGHEVPGLNWIKVDEKKGFEEVTLKFIREVQDKSKILFLADKKINSQQMQERYEGFVKSCEASNVEYIRKEVNTKDGNDLNSIIRFIRAEGISNVVCSSHEIYIVLANLAGNSLRLTDIGYKSIYDYIKHYKAKVFIDYPLIGVEIEKMILLNNVDGITQEKKIKARII
ncbi:LacI family DNA-binding transcriptional regulator [Mycoplasmopsis gallinacea]|uniref:LacI family DNA-binding transcriptional regulator n=1 Tax=Mycoplasmopsis gallinacea TaxID=29556 RepID=A0A6H0V352_9BACT|nr:LacI family DNA-binding transcriptional regulator [Mycoplasmopsis gallinacea]QIW62164.1 LacI family DNA-binding transcriptional regulator [Mycoplasmopsis gallinacea]